MTKLEKLVTGERAPFIARAVLAVAMVCSLAVAMRAGRGTGFSLDELQWASVSPGLGLSELLEPHSGHLIVVPRLLYIPILEGIGTGYLPFRLLTLFALFLTVALIYVYGARRLHPLVALAPCLVLLFFGPAAVHILQGNGFTILFAMACGLAALIAIERQDRLGDIVACAALVLGVLTYTVALAFVLACLVAVLLRRQRLRSLWVPAIPIAVYLAWRVWLITSGTEISRGEADLVNLLLTPSWAYQSLSAVAAALTGLSYDFAQTGQSAPSTWIGPPLALVAIAGLIWTLRRQGMSRGLWVVTALAAGMFALQVVGWIPTLRQPGLNRYLFPATIVVIVFAIELIRGREWGVTALRTLACIVVFAITCNVVVMRDEGRRLREDNLLRRADVTAAILLDTADRAAIGPSAIRADSVLLVPPGGRMAVAEAEYGTFGLDRSDPLVEPAEARTRIDAVLPQLYGIELAPIQRDEEARTGACREFSPTEADHVIIGLPQGPLSISSRDGADQVALGRFADLPSYSLASIPPGQTFKLNIPVDESNIPWRLSTRTKGVKICRIV